MKKLFCGRQINIIFNLIITINNNSNNPIIQFIYLYLEAFRINVLCRIYLRKGEEGVPQKQS